MGEGEKGRFCGRHEQWNPNGECPYCEPVDATIYVSDWQPMPRPMGVPIKVDPNLKGSDWELHAPAQPCSLRGCQDPADLGWRWVRRTGDAPRVLYFCWQHDMLAMLSQYADRWERVRSTSPASGSSPPARCADSSTP